MARLWAWLIVLLAVPTTALADPIRLPPLPGEPIAVGDVGLTLPPTLDGLLRTQRVDYGGPLNLSFSYGSDAQLSVYVYEVAAGTVPLWFDLAARSIEGRDAFYSDLTPALPPTAFAPVAGGLESGLMAIWTSGGKFQSTGLALFPAGPGLVVKLRVSSLDADPAMLRARMLTILAEVDWPTSVWGASDVQPMPPCAMPATGRGKAKAVRQDPAARRAYAVQWMTARAADVPRPPLCRDAGGDLPLPGGLASRVYRSLDDRQLVVGLSDAGVAMLAEAGPGAVTSVAVVIGGTTLLLPPLRQPPDAASLTVYANGTPPIARLEGRTVTVDQPEG